MSFCKRKQCCRLCLQCHFSEEYTFSMTMNIFDKKRPYRGTLKLSIWKVGRTQQVMVFIIIIQVWILSSIAHCNWVLYCWHIGFTNLYWSYEHVSCYLVLTIRRPKHQHLHLKALQRLVSPVTHEFKM